MDESKEVWKFAIAMRDVVEVTMPVNAEVLHFATQGPHETPYVWALVDPKMPQTKRRFRLMGTGHKLGVQGKATYVGTIHVHDRTLVLHLFDCGTASDAI